jgi:2-iminobutanoate/2-iminopropanoate deaminase
MTIKKEVLDVDRSLSKAPLSPVVKAGDFLFLSGAPPREEGKTEIAVTDIRRQTELVLNTLKRRLEASGSSLEKVVKCTVYVTNAGYFDLVNEVYARYFPKDPPARTFVNVGSWPWPFDIEIECIAIA